MPKVDRPAISREDQDLSERIERNERGSTMLKLPLRRHKKATIRWVVLSIVLMCGGIALSGPAQANEYAWKRCDTVSQWNDPKANATISVINTKVRGTNDFVSNSNGASLRTCQFTSYDVTFGYTTRRESKLKCTHLTGTNRWHAMANTKVNGIRTGDSPFEIMNSMSCDNQYRFLGFHTEALAWDSHSHIHVVWNNSSTSGDGAGGSARMSWRHGHFAS